MTHHTYKTILTHDSENESPIHAAMSMHAYLLEMATTMAVGDDRRPIYRVEQFVDTGVVPKVCFVDSLTWRAYADEGCTRLIDEDWFNGKIYNAMSPTPVMVSHIEVFDSEMGEAVELLANADNAELYPIGSDGMTYWAYTSELREILEDGTSIDGLEEWPRVALLAALAHVEERGAEEVHFHIQ